MWQKYIKHNQAEIYISYLSHMVDSNTKLMWRYHGIWRDFHVPRRDPTDVVTVEIAGEGALFDRDYLKAL